MKKLLIILCFLPMFSFGGTIYKVLSDTVFIGSIPYRTATGELLLFNNTKDTTESVLYNIGSGKTEFKKVRLIRLNDSTYVFKIGTTVIGDSIKIRSSGSGGGGGGSGSVTNVSALTIGTSGTDLTSSVANSTTTPVITLNVPTASASNRGALSSADWTTFNSKTRTYAGQGLFYRNDSLLITGRMTEPLSLLTVGAPLNNPTGGVAQYFADTPTRPAIGIGAYSDDFSYLTGHEIDNFNTTNTQAVQVGILNQASSSDLDDTKLFFVNAAGDKHTYLIGLPTTTYDQIVVRDSATNELAVVSARHYLDSVVQVASIPQSLSRTFTDSISIAITDGGNIKIPYGVDSVSATSDSIIVYKFGIRKSYTNGASGGASLSGLTLATATNTIDNGAYQQNWSWNSLTSGTGLKLSSNSTLASGNLQTVLEVAHSGTNATGSLKTFAARITSDKGANSLANTALYLSATGVSYSGLNNSRALEINSGDIYINASGTVNPYIRWSSGSALYDNTVGLMTFSTPATSNTGINFTTNAVYGVQGLNHFSGTSGWGLSNLATSRNALMLGAAGYFGGYYSGQTSAIVLERDADVFSISADNAIAGFFTPTKIVSVRGSTANMGIGTQTPVTSALLDMTSTTKGFLPPRMTTTQKNAISTPAEGLIIYDLTLHKLCIYTGSAWETITSL